MKPFKVLKGRGAQKLCRGQVAEIRARLERGESQTKIAQRFKVSQPMVHKIKAGKAWR